MKKIVTLMSLISMGGVALHISPVRAMKIKKDGDEIDLKKASKETIQEKLKNLEAIQENDRNAIKNYEEKIKYLKDKIDKTQKEIEIVEYELLSPQEKMSSNAFDYVNSGRGEFFSQTTEDFNQGLLSKKDFDDVAHKAMMNAIAENGDDRITRAKTIKNFLNDLLKEKTKE